MKLTQEQKEGQAQYIAEHPGAMRETEVAIFTLIGGGMLGHAAIDQPGDFYIDTRVGRLPYSKKAILQAVEVLALARQKVNSPQPYHCLLELPHLGIF